ISSQAFVDKYGGNAAVAKLLPASAELGLDFQPTHPKAEEALAWMGFEARSAILELLDQAIADKKAQVRAVLYDLNEPGVVTRLEQLGPRLKVIIDDDGKHGEPNSGESRAAARLRISAGDANVMRQHLGKLQHNKTVVVDGPKVKAALCGSTNHSWRGFFVQSNNALILRGRKPVKLFKQAFDDYFESKNSAAKFGKTTSAVWQKLGVGGVDAEIGFSPRSKKNAVLKSIADDIAQGTTSSLFFSLAFLYQTPGAIQNAVKKIRDDQQVFSYGISDHLVSGLEEAEASGIDLQKPSGTFTQVAPAALSGNVPEPFKSEPIGGGGTRMHHKFIVIDFNKPGARVYTGSYNFSVAADTSNGENLLRIRDRRIAVSYMIEALRIFDHYHFRLAQQEAHDAGRPLQLQLPPRNPGEQAWWEEYYSDPRKIQDRKLFA
ncbi:MAG TPA: phospholipase D-like domain-containing protein, partial [Steroidobacteraceae bacterium]|nr:phospholipase D-like domain-containing protein [Steroidobacteraceae bacterium]